MPGDVIRERRWELLTMALERTVPTYGPYVIDAYTAPVSVQREVEEVESGRLMNVMTSGSGSAELNASTIPVPIPIDKGLLGYRVALINRDQQARIDTIHDIDGLRTLRIGQAEDWGDGPVYRLAGIPLVTPNRYDRLFPMLASGRFDLLPRGVTEITQEFNAFQPRYPQLRIDSHLLIHYPYAQFFYVSRAAPLLARRINDGLEAMLKDGSFDALFRQHFGKAIADLHLERRVVIELKNPYLPPWVPLARKELWLVPLGSKTRRNTAAGGGQD
ncbi:MAG TPA: hypothetical protein VFE79_02740 [Paraburkholderia sp.]|nr:hypothetical protein [Paraburkholderia sp.]